MPKTPSPRPAHQIGALPWRRGAAELEVLLVTSRETRRWVIPKGWPMARLSDPEAAATEAWEEAGVKGLIGAAPIGGFTYDKRLKDGALRACRVKVYALEVTAHRDDWPEASERDRRWMPRAEAAEAVLEPELSRLILAFDPG